MRSSIVVAGLFAHLAGAIKPRFPQPTDALLDVDPYGVTPRPTNVPMDHYGLMRRSPAAQASSGSLLGWVAPDNTCGYVDGSLGLIKTCFSTNSCAAVALSSFAVLACCNAAAGQCSLLGICINSAQYWSSSACNQDCQDDYNTIKCTAATAPYCHSYIVPSMSAIAYQCASTTAASFGNLETTFSGETDRRTWTPLYDTSSGSSIFNGASTIQVTSISISSTPNPSPTPPSPTPTPQKSSSNAGPIAGGVVGGLVVVGAAAVAIVFLLRRRGGGSAGAAAGGRPGGEYSEPAGGMAAVGMAAVPPPVGHDPISDPNDPRYSAVSSMGGYYKHPDSGPTSYAGSPPPTYGMPGAPPQDTQYSPAQQPYPQQQYPQQQSYSPQPQYGQQAVPPQAASPVQNPYAPPPAPQQQQQPMAHELAGGEGTTPYAVPTTTAAGQPIYEAGGGRGA